MSKIWQCKHPASGEYVPIPDISIALPGLKLEGVKSEHSGTLTNIGPLSICFSIHCINELTLGTNLGCKANKCSEVGTGDGNGNGDCSKNGSTTENGLNVIYDSWKTPYPLSLARRSG